MCDLDFTLDAELIISGYAHWLWLRPLAASFCAISQQRDIMYSMYKCKIGNVNYLQYIIICVLPH